MRVLCVHVFALKWCSKSIKASNYYIIYSNIVYKFINMINWYKFMVEPMTNDLLIRSPASSERLRPPSGGGCGQDADPESHGAAVLFWNGVFLNGETSGHRKKLWNCWCNLEEQKLETPPMLIRLRNKRSPNRASANVGCWRCQNDPKIQWRMNR